MTTLRDSPSGKIVSFGQATSDIANASTHVSGATASDALDSLDTRITTFTRTRILERFIGGDFKNTGTASLVGTLGDQNWSMFGTGTGNFALRLSGPNTRYGQYGVGVLTNQRGGLVLSGTNAVAAGDGLLASQIVSVSWVGATNTSAGLNGKYRFGLGSTANGANFGSDGIYLESDREVNSVWTAITMRSGVRTNVNSLVTATNNTYYTLAFTRQSNGSFVFTVNGTTIATITSGNIPTGRMFPGAQIEATINSGQDMNVDTFDMEYLRAA